MVVPRAARRNGSLGSRTKGRRRQLYKSRAQSFTDLMSIMAHEVEIVGMGEGNSLKGICKQKLHGG